MLPDVIQDSPLWAPLFALGVFGAFVLAAAIVNLVFRVAINRIQSRRPDRLAVTILKIINGPIELFLVILGLFLGAFILTVLTDPAFEVFDTWDTWIRRAWAIMVIIEVTFVLSRFGEALLAWYIHHIAGRTESRLDDKLLPPIKRILPPTIYVLGALIALDSAGISISPLLAGLGIAGIAVALAIQPTLGNFLAGTFMVTEGEFREGDYLELDGGPSGYLVNIGWRSTKLRSRFNNSIIIPNSKMAESTITNLYSPTPALNVIVHDGVSYDSDLAHVERVAVEASQKVVDNSEHAIKDVEPFFGFDEFGDSNITFWVFVQATDRTGSFVLTSELVKGIHAAFKEEGIEINYPVRKLIYPSTNGHMTPPVFPQSPPVKQPTGDDGS